MKNFKKIRDFIFAKVATNQCLQTDRTSDLEFIPRSFTNPTLPPPPSTHKQALKDLQRPCRTSPCQILTQENQIWFSQKPDVSALKSKFSSTTGLEMIHSVNSENGALLYPRRFPRPHKPWNGSILRKVYDVENHRKIIKKSKISKFCDWLIFI